MALAIPVRFKDGVQVHADGLRPELWFAIEQVSQVYSSLGSQYIVITSLADGKHSTKSLHYRGLAADFRTRNLVVVDRMEAERRIAGRLDRGYDVVLEKTHLHIEYDPK